MALAIFLLSPGLPGYAAAGQVISAAVTGAAGVSAVQGNFSVVPVAAFSHAGVSLMPASLLAVPLTASVPNLTISVVPTAVSAAAPVAAAEERVLGPLVSAPARAAEQGKPDAAPAAMGVLRQGSSADSSKPESVEVSAQRMAGLMDGGTIRRDDGTPVIAGAGVFSQAAPLGKAQTAVQPEPKADLSVPSLPAAKPALAKKVLLVALAAGLILVFPTLALAAGVPVAGVVSATSVMGWLHPTASVVAAVVGAAYGAFVAYRKDGPPPSAVEVFASILRYGILGGAGVYACMDLSQVVFLGLRGAVSPLPAALATAALGQTAFQGKFTDPATSSADRIMAVFPVVAAALGLSIGGLKVSPDLLYSLGVGAMSATGVATALYAALYKPGQSPADGPAHMARGYVLQALMTGFALAVANPTIALAFAALAALGLGDVIYATGRAVVSLVMDILRQYWPPQKI